MCLQASALHRAVGAVACCVALCTVVATTMPTGARAESPAPAGPVLQADGCPISQVADGASLTAGLNEEGVEKLVVKQGEGATLSGALHGPTGPISGAWVCVYGEVWFGYERALLGIAVTHADGSFSFAVGPGPSRYVMAVYRSGAGELSATALLGTSVVPSLRLYSSTIHNLHYARFSGEIPGPGNDGVMVFLQVKSGKGWRVFRRYSTRNGGRFAMRYRFTRTHQPTIYIMRAQVVGGPMYPYLKGSSPPVALRVLP